MRMNRGKWIMPTGFAIASIAAINACAPSMTKQRAFEIAAAMEDVPVQSERDDWKTVDVSLEPGKRVVRGVRSYAWVRRHRAEPCAGTLVLIHGYLDSHLAWMAFMKEMERAHRDVLDRYDVCIPDLWGQGRTEVPDGVDDDLLEPPNTAQYVAAALDARALHPTWTVLGHSYGGPVACELTLIRPEHVVELMLIDSLGAERKEEERTASERALNHWFLGRLSGWYGLAFGFTRWFGSGGTKPTDETIDRRCAILASRGGAPLTERERDGLGVLAREGAEDLRRTRMPVIEPHPPLEPFASNHPFDDMLIAYAALNLVPEHYQSNRTLARRPLTADVATIDRLAMELRKGPSSSLRLRGRVHVVWGALDGLYSQPSHRKSIADRLCAIALVSPHAGHMLPRDDPSGLAALVVPLLPCNR